MPYAAGLSCAQLAGNHHWFNPSIAHQHYCKSGIVFEKPDRAACPIRAQLAKLARLSIAIREGLP